MGRSTKADSTSLSDLPLDELTVYAGELGLQVEPRTPRGELLRRIRARQELLVALDREALLEIVVWARRPVRRSSGKEALARQIATIARARFEGLSERGLRALAQLRGVDVTRADPRHAIDYELPENAPLLRLRRGAGT